MTVLKDIAKVKIPNSLILVPESASYCNYHLHSSAFTNVSVADILAARTDLLTIRKVSSVPPATRGIAKADNYGQLTKVKIGKVPDRGGRPSEQAPPPPEMPSWQQRTGPQHGQQGGEGQGGLHFFGGGQGGSGNRGGGHQGGGNNQRGGYNQGGYKQSGGYNQGGGYNQSGGYNQGGGYNQSGGNRGGYNQQGKFNSLRILRWSRA